MSAFYPPPPPFVGGPQPYAPQQKIPLSGSLPTPWLRSNTALLEILRVSWEPAVWWPLPQVKPQPQSAPAPNPPPSLVNYNQIVDAWYGPRPVFKYLGGGDTDGLPASQPPPTNNVQLNLIRQTWEPAPWWPLPALNVSAVSGPGFVSNPVPYVSPVYQRLIAETWEDSIWTVIEVPSIGSQFNPPQPIPPDSGVIRSSWNLPWSWAEYRQGAATIAPLIPVISSPPPSSVAILYTIISASQPPFQLPQTTEPVAQGIPAPSPPPNTQPANLRILLQSWDLPPPPYVYYPTGLAPFIKPPSQPPVVQTANLRILLQSWDTAPPPYLYGPVGRAAQTRPPSPPPPTSWALYTLLIDQWKPPVWWPLPSLVPQPQSAPPPTPTPKPVLNFPLRKYLVPNTIISPDAQTYVGPEPQTPTPPVFPIWMYNPVLPPVIAINQAQVNALIALGTLWSASYQPPYPVPNIAPQSVSAVVPIGVNDSFAPLGSVPGMTSRYLLLPAGLGVYLSGLPAAGDGWMVGIINTSPTVNLVLLNEASLTAGNSFILPNSAPLTLAPQEGAFLQWVGALSGWMFIS